MGCFVDMRFLSETLFVSFYHVYLSMSTKKRFEKFLTLTKVLFKY